MMKESGIGVVTRAEWGIVDGGVGNRRKKEKEKKASKNI